MTVHFRPVPSPLGPLTVATSDRGLLALEFPQDAWLLPRDGWREVDHPLLRQAQGQLDEYFRGDRRIFDLPLAPQGTPFQRQVWFALADIPYGQTTSYARLAARIGRPTAAPAVGAANGRNPLGIFLPCHRVVGAHGALTGFSGGLAAKQFLLELEGALPPMGPADLFSDAAVATRDRD